MAQMEFVHQSNRSFSASPAAPHLPHLTLVRKHGTGVPSGTGLAYQAGSSSSVSSTDLRRTGGSGRLTMMSCSAASSWRIHVAAMATKPLP